MATDTNVNEVSGLPQISTLRLSPAERALGRMTKLSVSRDPDGPAQSDLAGDIFHSLYQADPRRADQTPPERGVNKTVLDWARSMQSWESTRANTVANLPVAATTAGLMWEMLSQEEALKEALKKQEEADEKARQAAAAEAAAQGFEAAGMTDEADRAAAQAEALREEAGQIADQAAAAIDDAQGDAMTNAAVASAVRKAGQAGKRLAKEMAGWGFGPGSDVRTDPKAALEFARRNSAKVRQIALLAGRLRGIALQSRRERVTHGPITAEAGLTRDLMHVFPSELALLRPDVPPALRAQKVAQFAEGGLVGWRLRGNAEKRGPFVAAVDVSGSMIGHREIIAKAIALGVAQAAKAEGRSYVLFTFGADNDPVSVVESAQGWQQHVEWAEHSRGGGTSFNRALDETMSRLARLGKHCKGADALFISDGEAVVAQDVAAKWRRFKQLTSTRLLYVPVARGYGSIEALADQVIPVAELDPKAGEGLARDVAGWMR
ncbi:MAG TPA: hypothetical protein VJG32_17825 [Anaerolineae bacterium]|nr:hypothetical protein [Anaerolineae bacterium]